MRIIFSIYTQGGRGHQTVYYTKSFKMTFSYLLAQQLWRILIGWFNKLRVQWFQPLIAIYRRSNFVYDYLEMYINSRLLSYPLRSLIYTCQIQMSIKDIFITLITRGRTQDLWKRFGFNSSPPPPPSPLLSSVFLTIFLNLA